MFDFQILKKLAHYDWNKIIDETSPKGNKIKIDDASYQAIQSGSIIKILAALLMVFATLGLSYNLVRMTSGLTESGISSGISYNFQIFSTGLIPIAILIYNSLMRDKEQNSYPYFIGAIILAIETVSSLFSLVFMLFSFLISPIFSLIGIIAMLLSVLGNAFILVGAIEFAKRAHDLATADETKVAHPKIKTKAISTKDVAMHESPKYKYCPNCGQALGKDNKFCSNCGHAVK